ncbi:MAG: S8 family serine peptidase [Algoriphagus sp.]|nr:S8 family serine peptidase [Algoriphagus sp.]
MKNQKNLLKMPALYAGLIMGGLAFSCQQHDESPLATDTLEYIEYQNGIIIPGKYIVTLHSSGLNLRKDLSYESAQTTMRKSSVAILSKYRIAEENLDFVYGSSIEGFSVELSGVQLEALSKDPSVKLIEPDRVIALAPPNGKPGGWSTGQSVPWGITRVGGGQTYAGSGVAYIIDSGIEDAHPDLNVDSSLGFNSFTKGRDGDLLIDGNGHGTHVAGTVAAINNSIGVVGVAAGATVVPVKVLGTSGSGSYSGVIAGVDFVAANGKQGDVANMSLGGPASNALDAAVVALGNKGIKVSLAAGNEDDDANNHSPARANGPNIYTVSAINSNDIFASFSNYGNPPVDFAAPGVSVLSTYKGGGYTTFSGTSMSAPHVCGILLTGKPRSGGTAIGDPDGNPDPIAIK